MVCRPATRQAGRDDIEKGTVKSADKEKTKTALTDTFNAYNRLWYYYGRYAVSQGKTDTYSVEAELAWNAARVIFPVVRKP